MYHSNMACGHRLWDGRSTSVASAFLVMAIDAGEPVCIVKSVRINMVHAFGIPAGPRWLQDRAFRYFALGIARCGQLYDFKGTHLLAIKWCIILGIANDTLARLCRRRAVKPFPKHCHSSTRTRAMGVSLDEGILRMGPPRPQQGIGIVEPER